MDKSEFVPLFERVLVRRIKEEEQVEGGLQIPKTQQEKSQRGVIVAVAYDLAAHVERSRSDGTVLAISPLEVGTHVLIGKYAGIEQEIDGEDCVILNYREILGYFEPSAHER